LKISAFCREAIAEKLERLEAIKRLWVEKPGFSLLAGRLAASGCSGEGAEVQYLTTIAF